MIITTSRVPLSPQPQALNLIIGLQTYRLRLVYANIDQGGWILDIRTAEDDPIVCGIPLVTGVNLLGQYGYLGLGFALYAATAGQPGVPPSYESLGTTANLYVVQVQ